MFVFLYIIVGDNELQIVGPGGQDLFNDVDGPIIVYRKCLTFATTACPYISRLLYSHWKLRKLFSLDSYIALLKLCTARNKQARLF